MSDWQPIETAPRDGRRELLLYEQGYRYRGNEAFVGRWETWHKQWMSVPGAYARRPTHWMPLPEPPEAAHG